MDAVSRPQDDEQTTVDPVCGMHVDPRTSAHPHVYEGSSYFFCCTGCRAKFAADPQGFLKADSEPTKPMAEGTIYTCPMHPEIRHIGPGSCPICGMALEPLTATAETEPNHELIDMRRRFWIALALTVPVAVTDMGGPFFGLPAGLSNWLQFIVATPVVLWAGWPFFMRGWRSIVTRNLNMFTLIALGTGVAWTYSVVATLLPDAFPSDFRADDGSVAVYFEAAAAITVLVLLGQVLELSARARTSDAIRALLDLAPKTAHRIAADGAEADVPLDHVKVGDQLRVRPGEKIPVDGELVEG
ncbi:MAG TPA: heavy metal-binding domain-containing protein, partial [Beijerinckiaceae bacterium]|nr:heavy metal-binding domain-containing protein [Beijerinckiaceae bacterium]